jgi:phage-related protein
VAWDIEYYSDRIEKVVLNLPAGLLARYLHLTDAMLEFGPDLGMPHTRAMGDGLFELRLKSKEGIARVFYCTVIKQRIIMLHVFTKKSQKTPQKELDIARKRLKEVKDDSRKA